MCIRDRALDPGCSVAGVFTQNCFCAAPVHLCRRHLDSGSEIRALVINTGIANAGTGEAGLHAAQKTCAAVGQLFNINPNQVLPFSTGVILEPVSYTHLDVYKRQDITYGTNNEFGFDYLRDNMVYSASERVQRKLSYAIVDEVDSILIDEARTPLIISGPVSYTHLDVYKRQL